MITQVHPGRSRARPRRWAVALGAAVAASLVLQTTGMAHAATQNLGPYVVTDTVTTDPVAGTTTATYTVTVPARAKALSHLSVGLEVCVPARTLLSSSPTGAVTQTGDPSTGLTGLILKWDRGQEAGTTVTYSYTVSGLYEATTVPIALKSRTTYLGTVQGISCDEVAPHIAVTKTATPLTLAEPGGTATFAVSVTNTGVLPVTLTTLVDDVYGNLAGQGTCSVPQPLAVGATYSCTFTGPVAGDAGSTHVDTVTATAVDADGTTATAVDDATVGITDVLPRITLVKTATPGSLPEPGGTFTFSALVTNLSVEPVTLDTLVDDVYGDLNGLGTCSVPQVIAVGGTYACSFDGEFTGNADATQTDTIVASAVDNEGNRTADNDDATVTLTDVLPTILVDKAASVATVPENGAPVTFTVTVTNTSVEPVTLTSLVDDVYGDLAGLGTCATPQVIAIAGTYVCTFTQTVSGAAGTAHVDIVTGTAHDDDENIVTDDGTATVAIVDVLPAITVDKAAAPLTVAENGTVTFTVAVTNTSVEPVTLTTLVDDVYGNLDGKGTCAVPQTLAVAGTYTCTFTGGGFDAATSPHVDTVTATATDDDGNTTTDDDDATVTVTDVAPEIAVTKVAAPLTMPEPGGTFTFTVTVHNLSVEPVTITALDDDVYGDMNGLGTCATGGVLAPDAVYTCSFPGTFTGNAGATQTDVVTATAVDNDGTTDTDTATATVRLTDAAPTIGVTKTPSVDSVVAPGAPVTFTVTVTNTGTETVTLTSLVDDVYGNLAGVGTCATGATLPAAGTYTCSFTRTVSGAAGTTHVDVVTATATDDDGTPAVASDDATVLVVAAPPPPPVVEGGRVTHTGTTCQDYLAGANDLTSAQYGVKGGKIGNVAPGVFFYYTSVVAPSSDFTIAVTQSETSPTFSTLFGINNGQVRLYDGACATSSLATITTSGGQTSLSISGATPGETYVVSVKYTTGTVVGQSAPTPSTVHYDFTTSVNGVNVATDGLDLTKK
jgi:hypothetical protein